MHLLAADPRWHRPRRRGLDAALCAADVSKTVGAPIDGVITENDDAFVGVVNAVRKGEYDEIMISLLADPDSRWMLEDLPGRAESLGIPITIVRPSLVHTSTT